MFTDYRKYRKHRKIGRKKLPAFSTRQPQYYKKAFKSVLFLFLFLSIISVIKIIIY